MNITANELKLINNNFKNIENIRKNSSKEYDVTIFGSGYSAWLPLGAIRQINWTNSTVARLSDLPEMVLQGDWSGIRDSSDAAIWNIFERFVLRS